MARANNLPSIEALHAMSDAELASHIRDLRVELMWRPKGNASKAIQKHLAVAEKLRESQHGRKLAGGA